MIVEYCHDIMGIPSSLYRSPSDVIAYYLEEPHFKFGSLQSTSTTVTVDLIVLLARYQLLIAAFGHRFTRLDLKNTSTLFSFHHTKPTLT